MEKRSNYERKKYRETLGSDKGGKIFKAIQYTGGNIDEIKDLLKLKSFSVDQSDGSLLGETKFKKRMRIKLNDYIVYLGEGEYIACSEAIYKELYRRI